MVRFSATPTLDPTASLTLVAAKLHAPLAMAAPPRINAVIDVSQAPRVSLMPTPLTASRKRNLGAAFGATGMQLSEAPRPAAGSVPTTAWL